MKICQMKELGLLTWPIALFFQNFSSGSVRSISGHLFAYLGAAVLPHLVYFHTSEV